MSFTEQEKQRLIDQLNRGIRPKQVLIEGKTYSQICHELESLRECGRVTVSFAAKSWPKWEDRLLRKQVRKGIPSDKIVIPGRTVEAVRGRIKVLQRKGRSWNLKRIWSRREIRELRRQLAEGKSPAAVVIFGRTTEGVRKMVNKLHQQKKLPIYFRRPGHHRIWSGEEKQKLKAAYEELSAGKEAPKLIFQSGIVPGRAERDIRQQLIKLGLLKVNAKISAALKQARRLNAQELAEFKDFLSGEGRYWPSALVAKRFNLKDDFVCRRRRRWQLELRHDEAMNDAVYRQWFQKKVSERQKKAYAGRYILPDRTEDQLLREFCRDSIMHCGDALCHCERCRKQWYFNARYFHAIAVGSNGSSRRDIIAVCRVCRAERRLYR